MGGRCRAGGRWQPPSQALHRLLHAAPVALEEMLFLPFQSSVLARAPPRFSSFSPRRWHPPAVSTQLRSRSGEPRVWEGGAWETRGRGSVKGGGLWPWAHPVDLSSPLYRPFWSRVKCFSYPGLQRGQFADSTTYQTVVKHHVPDHALMELMV